MTSKQAIAILEAQEDTPHLCLRCKHIEDLCDRCPSDDTVWVGTTYDTNSCDLFYESCYGGSLVPPNGIIEKFGKTDNDRLYSHGMETVDNGGGYWIVSCPYYEELSSDYLQRIFYADYIKSKVWKKKRNERLSFDGYRCRQCGSAQNLRVHHITYERLGHEEMDDLITLCKDCHAKVHENDLAKKGVANE